MPFSILFLTGLELVRDGAECLLTPKLQQDSEPDCMRQDEVLYRIADKIKNFAVVSPPLPGVRSESKFR